MKKVLLSIIILIILGNNIFAQQQVSRMEAVNAAIHTYHSKSSALKLLGDAKVKTIYNSHNMRGDTLMYEIVFQNNVGVLLSGSKACLPVLAYYTKPEYDNGSIFDTNNKNVPCCFRNLLREYTHEIDSCFLKKTKDLHYVTKWQELQDTEQKRISKSGIDIVKPLLKTEWNQDYSNDYYCDAYNYYVTETHKKCNCSSKYCPVGCVAVAMAQIMKHWNYPVYIPFKAEQYDWCNMPNELNYSGNSNYEKERHAIAYLMKDCGDAANTNYCNGGCSSSSIVYKARQALVNKLGYSSDADHQWKSSYSIKKWKQRIKNNLDDGMPVLYGGYDPSPPSGHSFVLDGYTDEDYFHVNWGWGSGYNAYCTLDDLTLSNQTYSTQSACFYIHPAEQQDFCNFTLPLLMHYILGGTHQNVPKTLMILESVPNGLSAAWRTIPAGSNVIYEAHKSVKLNPGFKVEVGASFKAQVTPCERCD
jgi:hypothetical protein